MSSTKTSSSIATWRKSERSGQPFWAASWGGIQFDRVPEIWESGFVKTTLEIDDELYREAKAHASLTGQKMKDLVTEGLRLALRVEVKPVASAAASRELAACFAEADQLMKAAPRGPIAREHLNRGRNRLDKA